MKAGTKNRFDVDSLNFTSRDSKGLICWWDVTAPKTNYWHTHYSLGRAYALELIDMIQLANEKVREERKSTFGAIASTIVRKADEIPNDGLYMGFFDTISEFLITGDVAR
ncbi:MAG: hypothetical protein ABW176_13010 [Candidatus Thiodiazotropha endolucinida]